MFSFWRDLSVSKKLYAVVGVMAVLIAIELFSLLFAMNVMTAVRSFVAGEGLWSKGQKDAVHSLHRYGFTRDPRYLEDFHRNLQINMGDRQARLEMAQPDANLAVVTEGFIKGGNHPEDVPGLIWLIREFHWVKPIESALAVWAKADAGIDELLAAAEALDQTIRTDPNNSELINSQLRKLDKLNDELTLIENEFSQILGAGSRWLESLLMIVLVLAVLTVESTGVILTVMFSRNLNRSLTELISSAEEIGRGNFDVSVPVRSRDELGQLADKINKMAADLKKSHSSRDRAENASQVKSQFLANMSHEIRTPLGVMLGLTEILKDPNLSRQDHMHYVDTIERTGKNLTNIINDILDLSKVEAGHLDIHRSQFPLTEFLNELKMMLEVQAEKSENALTFKPSGGELPLQITTDRTRLRQILVNLVTNALKYTSGGHVELSYRFDGSRMVFEVKDTGRGITNEVREKLFEAFIRTDNPELDKPEGTGLGLMLSQRLVRALGGDVTLVHSEPGVGSLFRATVSCVGQPQLAVKVAAKRDGLVDNLSGRKILVVEDSEDNQLLVKLFLTRAGMIVDFANNGKEGVERALANESYDAILMDMQMPVMDGYSATKELRERGYVKPIIALTARAMKDDRDRCLSVGCSDYLTKPVDSKSLSEIISRHLPLTEGNHEHQDRV